MPYVLALDEGTTSARAIVFDSNGAIKVVAQKEFTQNYPQPGWVEHDAEEIWAAQIGVAVEALNRARISAKDLVCRLLLEKKKYNRQESANRQTTKEHVERRHYMLAVQTLFTS